MVFATSVILELVRVLARSDLRSKSAPYVEGTTRPSVGQLELYSYEWVWPDMRDHSISELGSSRRLGLGTKPEASEESACGVEEENCIRGYRYRIVAVESGRS